MCGPEPSYIYKFSNTTGCSGFPREVEGQDAMTICVDLHLKNISYKASQKSLLHQSIIYKLYINFPL